MGLLRERVRRFKEGPSAVLLQSGVDEKCLDSIRSARKFYLEHVSVVSCMRGESGKADIEELEEMDASELHARRLNAKEVLTPQRSGNVISSENIHLNPGAFGRRRRTRKSSRKVR